MGKNKFDEKTIEINGSKIHYYIYGKGDPLLFIHGHRSDSLRWRNLIGALGGKFKVYSPDLPGFGKSEKFNTWHTMNGYAEFLLKFAKKLKLKDYVIFGGSMGGIIALHMLKNDSKASRKLVLLGTPYDKSCLKANEKVRSALCFILRAAIKSKIAGLIIDKAMNNDFILHTIVKRSIPPYAWKEKIIRHEMRDWRMVSAKIWAQTLYGMLTVNFASLEIKIRVPALILASKSDNFLKTEENNKGLKKLLPNSTVAFIPTKKHMPFGDLPPSYIKKLMFLIDPFLNH